MVTDLSKLLSELAAVPVRAQEKMDASWLEELRRLRAWKTLQPTPVGAELLSEEPMLEKALLPDRPFIAKYELSVMLRVEVERTTGFRIMAEPLNAAWSAVFGSESEAPRLGYEVWHRRRTTKETSIEVNIVQTPCSIPAGGIEPHTN